ncbi:hypothetical protein BV22DRAFT_156044 [Leucogyrophana mollusca]|uniref:Uncharacterized protein n=1 Tax=Leucogyrophana mollusca TaxID=85980 RepID=A0ACB8BUI0_9AGAM|nr:hypothetical protein BV22DRAFT_156044 [Leucogyrophana mollusca]
MKHTPDARACVPSYTSYSDGQLTPWDHPFQSPTQSAIMQSKLAKLSAPFNFNKPPLPSIRSSRMTDADSNELSSSSGSQSPGAHIHTWKGVSAQAVVVTGTNTFVPQLIYQPNSRTDRQRYVRDATLSPPIIFFAEGTHEWGIPLEAALERRINCLKDRDDSVLERCGPSVSIRLQWPGYFPRHESIPTRDYRSPPTPITKAKLAKNIARLLRRFMDDMAKQAMDEDANPTWRVGTRHIRFEDLILVSLHHVSQGSWQPQLRLRREINTPRVEQQPTH